MHAAGRALLLLASATILAAAADPVKITVISRNTQLLPEALAQFEKTYGKGLVDLRILGERDSFDGLASSDVIVCYYGMVQTFQKTAEAAKAASARGALVVAAPRLNGDRFWQTPVGEPQARVEQYWENGGVDNLTAFLAYAYAQAGGSRKLTVPEPKAEPTSGIYHPASVRPFASLGEYLAWYRAQGRVPADAPLVGIVMYHQTYKFRDLAAVDALIEGLEKRKTGAVAIYGWPVSTLDAFLTVDKSEPSPIEVLLALNLGFSKAEDAAALERHGIHVINLMTSTESYSEWEKSTKGIVAHRLPTLLNSPERLGASEPILIATTEKQPGSDATYLQPVAERIDVTVRRALRWITLRHKPNAEKRIAFIYYSNPPGKGYLGASYLNLMPTLVTLVERLKESGYVTGNRIPDEQRMIEMLHRSGRNIELWAPGELEEMVEKGSVALVSMAKYKAWFAKLPKQFREFVNKEWGPPEQQRLMTIVSRDGQRYFVVPGIRLGNIFLGPQPLRTSFERAADVSHDTVTPPPHSYVAAYLWYRNEFQADAAIHMGRHGTLEWLPGKHVGQGGWDSSEVLLDDLPSPYYFIMDGGGEAIQAKRRSASVMIGHLTPMIARPGEQDDFARIKKAHDNYEATEGSSPALAAQYKDEVFSEIRRLKIDRQLGISLDTIEWEDLHERLHGFFDATDNAPTPMGLHTVGTLAREDLVREAVEVFLRFQLRDDEVRKVEPLLAGWAAALIAEEKPQIPSAMSPVFRDRCLTLLDETRQWLANLRVSPQAEVEAMVRVLDGRYLPSALLGDPLRVPAGLPSGRNLHDFDTAQMPTRAAWALGKKLAEDMLAKYRKEKGRYPEKVSMVLWYGETARSHGAMESQALYLMGVEPVWNSRGLPDSLRLIPEKELGRPRVDVVFTISGIYRDGFADKVLLLDKASRLAAGASADNAIARSTARIAAELEKAGVAHEQALQAARARVFGAEPGNYGTGIQHIIEQSKDEGQGKGIAEMYLHHMNFAYSQELWGASVGKALEVQLKGNEAVLHSRTTNVYGVLDNDDFYQFAGGLNAASKAANGGEIPEFYVYNLRRRNRESVDSFRTFLVHEMNTRHWNPKWIREMQNSGYAGARQFAKEIEHLYGWQATSGEHVSGQMWQNTFDVYVADKHGLEMDAFFERANPHVRQFVLSRLLEVDRQGTYQFSDEDRAKIVKEYVQSVARHGVACSANTCGNLRLNQYAAEQAGSIPGLGNLELSSFGRNLSKATHWSAAQFQGAPRVMQAGMRRSAARPATAAPAAVAVPRSGLTQVNGYRMQEQTIRPNVTQRHAGTAPETSTALGLALLSVVAIGGAVEWRQRGRVDRLR